MAGTFGERTPGFGARQPGVTRPTAPTLRPPSATQAPPPLRFDYRPAPFKSLLGTVVTGAAAVFLAWTARDNDRGLIIDHMIRLDPAQATLFWWGMAAVCGVGFLLALFMLVLAVSPPRQVILDAAGITAPRNAFTTETITIGYRSITDVRIVTVKRHRTLTIHHSGGSLAIAETVIGDPFEALVDALAEGCTSRR